MFHKLRKEAERKYGVSTQRPQDQDKNMLVIARRNNFGIMEAPTTNYEESVRSNATEFQMAKAELPQINLKQTIQWLSDDWGLLDADALMCSKVIAMDLEFHNKDTYEGFICVTSIAMAGTTYVVDCLYDSRDKAIKICADLLINTTMLKVFCGGQQDLIRIKKDWDTFPTTIVDLQDMFNVWKGKDFAACLEATRDVVKAILLSKQQSTNEESICNYLSNYNQPGLSFLIKVFLNTDSCKVEKDEIATHADFRKRPLHPDLITYAATDATATLAIFTILARKIKLDGIKKATLDGITKLCNTSRAPVYKSSKSKTNDFTEVQLRKWREYIAKNLDKDPDSLLSEKQISKLGAQLKGLDTDEEQIQKLLHSHGFKDDSIKAARLLCAYLDKDQVQLRKMQSTICHRCNKTGHSANFCITVLTHEEERERKREFRNREEMKEKNVDQHNRRWHNYCRKRNLDPLTAKKPWE